MNACARGIDARSSSSTKFAATCALWWTTGNCSAISWKRKRLRIATCIPYALFDATHAKGRGAICEQTKYFVILFDLNPVTLFDLTFGTAQMSSRSQTPTITNACCKSTHAHLNVHNMKPIQTTRYCERFQSIVAANFCLHNNSKHLVAVCTYAARIGDPRTHPSRPNAIRAPRSSPAHPNAHDALERTSIVVKKDVQGRRSVRPRRGRVTSA